MKIHLHNSSTTSTVFAWALTILGIGLELVAAAIFQEANLGASIAHVIVSFFK